MKLRDQGYALVVPRGGREGMPSLGLKKFFKI